MSLLIRNIARHLRSSLLRMSLGAVVLYTFLGILIGTFILYLLLGT